jgi:iduronate 2-sulfatase
MADDLPFGGVGSTPQSQAASLARSCSARAGMIGAARPVIWIFAFWVAGNPSLGLAQQPYNVLFIAVDDLRTDLGCYGHPVVKTPNLDGLADRGVLFEKAYCQQALCNPSRSSVMTGLMVDTLRIWDLRTHFRDNVPNVVTLPEHFKERGYFTQNIGKIYHNWIHQRQGDPQSWSVPAEMHFATHNSDIPQVDGRLPPNLALDPKCECRDVPDDAYFDGRVAQLAIDALRERAVEEQPFFLAIGFWKPHSPFNAPKRYWDLYQRDEIDRLPAESVSWPESAPDIAWHNSRELLGEGSEARELSDDAAQEIRHGYLANVSYLDAQIGKLLDALEQLALIEKTIVVFWSDHGYHLGEHALWAKTSNFERDARVPLIITVPNRGSLQGLSTGSGNEVLSDEGGSEQNTRSARSDAVVELIDLYPTLLELCDLGVRQECEGRSIVPILANPQAVVRVTALTQHPRPAYYRGLPEVMGYSIRTQTHRYTEWRDWKSGEAVARELYDHRIDAGERSNIADIPEHHAAVRDHARLLDERRPLVSPGWRE